MRALIVLMASLAVLAFSRTAAAEPSRMAPSWDAPVLSLSLIDGFRGNSIDIGVRRSVSTQAAATPKEPVREPGEELTEYVERMWSQVRAYRRPGGAEFIVRGRF